MVKLLSNDQTNNMLLHCFLQAEVMGLETRLDAPLEATVLEARKDKGLGVVVTAVLREGTLRVGDIVVAGAAWGRVKRLISDSGASLQLALPSVPIQV